MPSRRPCCPWRTFTLFVVTGLTAHIKCRIAMEYKNIAYINIMLCYNSMMLTELY
jgi:hypothetical protein